MARKVRNKKSKQPPTWPDPFIEDEDEDGGSGGSSNGTGPDVTKLSAKEKLAWQDLTEEDDEGGDEGGSGGFGWPIDEERVSDIFLGTIAEDISKNHILNQEQSIPKETHGGEGPGLTIEKHPLISFNGVDMRIDTIQTMTEDERNTYEFSHEYQLRNQARLSKRLSASSAPKLTRSR